MNARTHCECTTVCGEDPRLATGRAAPCAARIEEFRRRAELRALAPAPEPAPAAAPNAIPCPSPVTVGAPAMPVFTPSPGSTADRVCHYFRANPAVECLTAKQIAELFKVKSSEVPMHLKQSVDARLLDRIRRYGGRDHTFSRGPKFDAPDAVQAPAAAPATVTAADADQVRQFVARQPDVYREPFNPPPAAKPAGKLLGATASTAAQFKRLQEQCSLAVVATRSLLALLDRMEPDTPDDQRATDEEWIATKRSAQAALASIEASAI